MVVTPPDGEALRAAWLALVPAWPSRLFPGLSVPRLPRGRAGGVRADGGTTGASTAGEVAVPAGIKIPPTVGAGAGDAADGGCTGGLAADGDGAGCTALDADIAAESRPPAPTPANVLFRPLPAPS